MQWRRTHEDRWTNSHLPLLCTVCAAQERLALPALAELAEVQEPASYRLLTSEWRPFITVTLENDGEHFELYHASLRDFFSGSVSLDDLTSGEQAFANELRTATRMRHRRIAALYQQQWGGATLEKLRDERDVGYRDSYGWRHVVAHLVHGEDDEALMNLLKTEWTFVEEVPNLMPGWAGRLIDWTGRRPITRLGIPRSGWFESHARTGDLALFLLDWDRAGRMGAAREDGDGAFLARHMVLEIAAYLVKSSVRDAALRVPFGVVTALVRCRRWSIDQAIAYARHVADRATRAELLTELATLDSSSRPAVIREALEAIDGLEDLGKRAIALTRLLETGLTENAVVTRNVLDVLGQLDASALVEHGPRIVPYLADSEWPDRPLPCRRSAHSASSASHAHSLGGPTGGCVAFAGSAERCQTGMRAPAGRGWRRRRRRAQSDTGNPRLIERRQRCDIVRGTGARIG